MIMHAQLEPTKQYVLAQSRNGPLSYYPHMVPALEYLVDEGLSIAYFDTALGEVREQPLNKDALRHRSVYLYDMDIPTNDDVKEERVPIIYTPSAADLVLEVPHPNILQGTYRWETISERVKQILKSGPMPAEHTDQDPSSDAPGNEYITDAPRQGYSSRIASPRELGMSPVKVGDLPGLDDLVESLPFNSYVGNARRQQIIPYASGMRPRALLFCERQPSFDEAFKLPSLNTTELNDVELWVPSDHVMEHNYDWPRITELIRSHFLDN